MKIKPREKRENAMSTLFWQNEKKYFFVNLYEFRYV